MIRFRTTVERVALNYNTPQQVELERLTLDEARPYLSKGQFLLREYGSQDRSGCGSDLSVHRRFTGNRSGHISYRWFYLLHSEIISRIDDSEGKLFIHPCV